jgi:hypothetical protein
MNCGFIGRPQVCSWMQAKKILGMTGLPVLCNILKEDRGDREMLRGALECLNIAIAPTPVPPPPPFRPPRNKRMAVV